jgi:hypothetical protein
MNFETNIINYGNLALKHVFYYYLGLHSTETIFLSRFPEFLNVQNVQRRHSVSHFASVALIVYGYSL